MDGIPSYHSSPCMLQIFKLMMIASLPIFELDRVDIFIPPGTFRFIYLLRFRVYTILYR